MITSFRVAGNFHQQANLAWERFNPDKVSKPEHDAERAAWISGYLAALQDAGFADGGLFREGETSNYATAYYKVEATDDPLLFIARYVETLEVTRS
jgi:hypothetical protein